jgi:hypothetical protein
MNASLYDRALLAWLIGAFHTTGLMLVLVFFLFVRGSLGDTLDNFGTGSGLFLFLVLWAVTLGAGVMAARRVQLEGPNLDVLSMLIVEATLWGGAAGVAFLMALLVTGIVSEGGARLAQGEIEDAVGIIIALLVFVGFIGSMVASVVGAAVGLVFGLLDAALLALARSLTSKQEK